MALLAHYLFNESPGVTPVTAIDVAGGGSGYHDASYTWMSNGDGILSGGVGGRHIKFKYSSGSTTTLVDSFDNNSDFNTLGEVTISFWLYPINAGLAFMGSDNGVTGPDDNQDITIDWWSSGVMRFIWEHTNHTGIVISSTSSMIDMNEWQHFVIRRSLFSGGPNMQVDFFKNGVLEETYDNSSSGYTPHDGGSLCSFKIGKVQRGWVVGGECMSDSIRIYNSAESDVTIAALYATEEEDFFGSPGVKFLSTPYDRRVAKTSSNHFGNVLETGERSSRDNPGFFRITA